MRLRVCSGHWGAVSRIALVGLIGSAAAACSTDSARFAENPFSNPFAASERMDSTASMAPQPAPSYSAAPMPTPTVQAQALPPVQSQPLSQPARIASAPAPVQPRPTPVAQAAPAQPASRPQFRLVDTSKVPAATTPVTAAEPVKRVRPGMAQTAQAPAPSAPAPARSAPVQVAAATNEPLVSAPKPLVSAPKPVVEQPKVAALTQPEPVKPAVVQPVAPAPQPEAAKAPVPEPEQTASLSGDFRWPARGRVIAGFGANGGNEGINIAVPEGTPVKAAEAGTVTYAGSEVKGYGNLVLIKHENGYVSAYAHNGSLNVKRGEQVKRGQVIATSGQTGNVTSPQLHFEIRKGAQPVDPMKHLGG
ncbi:peptidoglycan DD-metalloendopeptidase family protein [Microvirga lotononidis]|uniref:Metalloendopeptidase-like membrane protein n=1 Tax=Microvirga lotononidis TaxID=864069 RepID=I4YX21_9HYPH|nr:peptidoglycan DD-metalloendopeptidase family protein [Microvirga lotononidis]EIM28513.1 metalloendopeptidase-like membrane protein [Microvirga lotononidis]WQO27416.1 peptidoglycan DD-metalloendopeptidase family protein [Microvirga lotononidis]